MSTLTTDTDATSLLVLPETGDMAPCFPFSRKREKVARRAG